MKTAGSGPRRAEKSAAPEAYTTGLQPSMSRSDILLNCAFPFGKEVEDVAGEPARYGSAFHDLEANMLGNVLLDWNVRSMPKAVVKKWGFEEELVDEIVPHVTTAYKKLMEWLAHNEFRIDFLAEAKKTTLIEEAVALKPLLRGRRIDKHDDEHRYHGIEPGEFPGTLDLAIVPQKRKLPILIVDHKTGEEDFSRPDLKAQLRSLGAAVMRWTGAKEAILAVLHARRRGLPKVYAEKVTLDDLHEHEHKLGLSLSRIGDGSMKPGPWCDHCPAQDICPARDSHLLDTAGDVLTGLTAAGGALSIKGLTANDVLVHKAGQSLTREKKLGLLYTIAKKAEVMAARCRAEIKEDILGHPGLLPVTLDGENLVIRAYTKESLSKQAIIDAYGKVKGEKVLKKLRKDGAIREIPIQALYPEKERGR